MNKNKIVKIFGINFIDAKYKTIKSLLDKGGLLVLPSGPGLSDIKNNTEYHKALKNADIALFDSGYLSLLLRLKGIKVNKFSGYHFFKKLIVSLQNERNKKIFLVDPNHKQSKINKEFLQSKKISKIYQYVAPLYKKNKIQDLKLLNKIKKIRPEYIIINIGGGVQEILGNYLEFKEHDASFIRYLAASFSCKAAIKAGDKIEKEEMSNLINRLFSTDNPYYCPHGRPIVIKITEEELDKRFDRK